MENQIGFTDEELLGTSKPVASAPVGSVGFSDAELSGPSKTIPEWQKNVDSKTVTVDKPYDVRDVLASLPTQMARGVLALPGDAVDLGQAIKREVEDIYRAPTDNVIQQRKAQDAINLANERYIPGTGAFFDNVYEGITGRKPYEAQNGLERILQGAAGVAGPGALVKGARALNGASKALNIAKAVGSEVVPSLAIAGTGEAAQQMGITSPLANLALGAAAGMGANKLQSNIVNGAPKIKNKVAIVPEKLQSELSTMKANDMAGLPDADSLNIPRTENVKPDIATVANKIITDAEGNAIAAKTAASDVLPKDTNAQFIGDDARKVLSPNEEALFNKYDSEYKKLNNKDVSFDTQFIKDKAQEIKNNYVSEKSVEHDFKNDPNIKFLDSLINDSTEKPLTRLKGISDDKQNVFPKLESTVQEGFSALYRTFADKLMEQGKNNDVGVKLDGAENVTRSNVDGGVDRGTTKEIRTASSSDIFGERSQDGNSGQRPISNAGISRVSEEAAGNKVPRSEGVDKVFFGKTPVDVEYKVVDRSSIKTSHDAEGNVNESYPQQYQPRDRSSKSSRAQVQDMANSFSPDRLLKNPESNAGAPIIDTNGNVISGNGRTAMIDIATRDPAKKQAYIDKLKENGYFVDGIENPVLVAQFKNKIPENEVINLANKNLGNGGLEPSFIENATKNSMKITDNFLEKVKSDNINSLENAPAIREFFKDTETSKLGGIFDSSGKLTAKGVNDIEAAIVKKAYDNDTLIDKAFNVDDNNVKSVTNGLTGAAADWAKMREAIKSGDISPSHDITGKINDFLDVVIDAKNKNKPVKEILSQSDFIRKEIPGEVVALFLKPDGSMRAGLKISENLENYAKMARENVASPMFGDKVAAEKVMEAAVKKTGDDFSAYDSVKEPPKKPSFSRKISIDEATAYVKAREGYQAFKDTFRSGVVGKLLNRDPFDVSLRDKQTPINKKFNNESAAPIIESFMPSGEKGAVNAREFLDAAGNTPEARKVLFDIIEYNIEKKGFKNQADVDKFMSNNKSVIEILGDEAKFKLDNIKSKFSAAELAENALKEVNKSIVARVANGHGAASSIIRNDTVKSNNSAADVKDFFNRFGKDETTIRQAADLLTAKFGDTQVAQNISAEPVKTAKVFEQWRAQNKSAIELMPDNVKAEFSDLGAVLNRYAENHRVWNEAGLAKSFEGGNIADLPKRAADAILDGANKEEFNVLWNKVKDNPEAVTGLKSAVARGMAEEITKNGVDKVKSALASQNNLSKIFTPAEINGINMAVESVKNSRLTKAVHSAVDNEVGKLISPKSATMMAGYGAATGNVPLITAAGASLVAKTGANIIDNFLQKQQISYLEQAIVNPEFSRALSKFEADKPNVQKNLERAYMTSVLQSTLAAKNADDNKPYKDKYGVTYTDKNGNLIKQKNYQPSGVIK